MFDVYSNLLAMRRDRSHEFKVAVDIDGTIADVHRVMLSEFNRKNGTDFSTYDIKDWGFKSLGSSYAEMMPFYQDAWKNHHDQIPFVGKASMILELSKYYTVHFLTSRSNDENSITGGTEKGLSEWLTLHGIDSIPVVLCPPEVSKTEFGYQIYIDDSPMFAKDIEKSRTSGEGRILLLIDKPYNRDTRTGSNIVRVPDVNFSIDLLINVARRSESNTRILSRLRNR